MIVREFLNYYNNEPKHHDKIIYYRCNFTNINFTYMFFAWKAILIDCRFENCNIPQEYKNRLSGIPDGQFTMWKKCLNRSESIHLIVELSVPADAQRACQLNKYDEKKIRVSHAEVVSISEQGTGKPRKEAWSQYAQDKIDKSFVYRVGKIVRAKNFDPSEHEECAGGIHGFLHKLSAENW